MSYELWFDRLFWGCTNCGSRVTFEAVRAAVLCDSFGADELWFERLI